MAERSRERSKKREVNGKTHASIDEARAPIGALGYSVLLPRLRGEG